MASNSGRNDPLQAAVRARKLATFFTEDVILEVPVAMDRVEGRDAVQQLAVQALVRAEALRIEITGIEVETRDGPNGLEVESGCAIRAEIREHGQRYQEFTEAVITWTREQGDWRIQRAEPVEPFAAPGDGRRMRELRRNL